MIEAMHIGLSGMRAAETAVNARATNIVNMNTKGYVPTQPVMKSTGNGVKTTVEKQVLAPETQQAIAEVPGGALDLASELIQMRLAEIAYRASAKVVEAAGRMEDEALKAIG